MQSKVKGANESADTFINHSLSAKANKIKWRSRMTSLQELKYELDRVREFKEITVEELLILAKQGGIVGRHKMRKEELREKVITAIEGEMNKAYARRNAGATTLVALSNLTASNKDLATNASTTAINPKTTYVETAAIGMMVAFIDKRSFGKVRSAKIIERLPEKRSLRLETEYGWNFTIPYEDVIWVRTTKRWPRGIYNALKGIKESGKENT